MDKNVGKHARWLRGIMGTMALTCSVMAPLPWMVRLSVFGTLGLYLLFSALSGRCLFGRLLARRSESRS
jgi:hypothetical protein